MKLKVKIQKMLVRKNNNILFMIKLVKDQKHHKTKVQTQEII